MGEILGVSNLSCTLVAIQIKDQVPYAVAHKLYTKLIQTVSPSSSQQIIENFRAQYLIVNETILFVFSTLTENPFLSLDSLYKLQLFLQLFAKDLKIESIFKKTLEVNYGIEDILNGMDPTCRLNPKIPLFSTSKPFQSFYSNTSQLLYMNKPWKIEKNGSVSAYSKACTAISNEKDLRGLSFKLPPANPLPKPLIHPFAVQFIDPVPYIKAKKVAQITQRISENSSLNLNIDFSPPKEVCKLAIMEKTFVAFKNTTITNLRVVGQFGIELYSRSEGKGLVKLTNLDWSDSKKIGKRLNDEFIKEIDDFSYEVAVDKMKETTKVIEYIVSPNVIEIKNLPIFVMFNCERAENSWIVQIKYQVSVNWKNPLEEVVFLVLLNAAFIELNEINSRGELIGNTLQWKIPKLLNSQKGILEARVKCVICRIDHTKIQFRSNNSLLSPVSATFTFNSVTSGASLKYLSEIVISGDTN